MISPEQKIDALTSRQQRVFNILCTGVELRHVATEKHFFLYDIANRCKYSVSSYVAAATFAALKNANVIKYVRLEGKEEVYMVLAKYYLATCESQKNKPSAFGIVSVEAMKNWNAVEPVSFTSRLIPDKKTLDALSAKFRLADSHRVKSRGLLP
jgi:hypothetical protein